MSTHGLINHVANGHLLTRAQAEEVMEEILSGQVDTAEIVRLLTGLNTRPLQAQELTGFASVMRRHAAPVFANNGLQPAKLVDTCGTGGDYSGTFNISTAAAIVAAAAGACVAKHGNRSASSRCGSADVLEALGVRIEVPLEYCGQGIEKLGIGFLFAPVAHVATRHAAPARKQIGARTIFNLLGPLTNPAGAKHQVLGVFSLEALDLVAATLAELGTERAFVVYGAVGLDEISLEGETLIAEVREGAVRRFTVTPEEFGVSRAPLEALRGGAPNRNAEIIQNIFAGEPGPQRDVVVMNGAAALVAAGIATNFVEGAHLAMTAIATGAAREKLAAVIAFTNAD